MKKNEWIDLEKADIWWNQVSGPKAYLQEVVQNIKGGHCIALEKEDVDTEFFFFLEQKVRSIDSSYLFDAFRVDDYDSESDFQDDFIKRLAPEFDWGFASPYKELIETGYIAHHLIYLEIDQKKDWAIQVMKMFSELSSQGNGVIVCLAPSLSMLEGIGRLKRVSLGSYLSIYNLQYFALQCLGNFETRDSKGMYIAQIAASCLRQMAFYVQSWQNRICFLILLMFAGIYRMMWLKKRFGKHRYRFFCLLLKGFVDI